MQELIMYLNSIYPLSKECIEYLETTLKRKIVPKGDFILSETEVCNKICFVEKGLVRSYYLQLEKEINVWFMQKGDVVVSIQSFFEQIPSNEYIQALELSTLHFITHSELEFAYKQYIEFNIVGRIILQRYYVLETQRTFLLRIPSAADRYEHLTKEFPEIVQKVPSKHIATYLGVTEFTLSHIRRELMLKQRT